MSSESTFHRVVGIDLGTTYSAVAVYDSDSDQAQVLKDPETKKMTVPSVISYDRVRNRVIVGEVAKRNRAADPGNTVIEIKREMGELFRPETLAKFDPSGRGGFRAKQEGAGGYPGDPVKVRFCGEWYTPQKISAFTLMKLKWIAEQALGGEEIRDAVVTVPAYFTERQRSATKEAALLAGLYPRQLIPEPTAAAICYGVDQYVESRMVYLVYDLGGGTFDVSIIAVEEDNIEVIATSGDPRLGGSDFDDAITSWAVDQLFAHHHLDIRGDARAREIVKYHAEKLKILLSTYEAEKMDLPELRPQNPPILELTRTKFEELIDSDLSKSLSYVDTAIRDAEEHGVRRDDIDAILLVGGSSRIPIVRTRLLEYFQAEQSFVRADLDPDAVVARGAAMLAKRFSQSPAPFDIRREAVDREATDDDLNVHLITEHSLGIGVQDNKVVKIVAKGTGQPVSVTRGGFVNAGPTDYIYVQVYQGEGDFVFDNELIGEVPLGPMEPKPEGHHKFEVTFTLDRSGLFTAAVNHLNENDIYRAAFQQRTAIGGREALAALRERLLDLYRPDAEGVVGRVHVEQVAPPAILGESAASMGGPSHGQEAVPGPVPGPYPSDSLQPGYTAPQSASGTPVEGPTTASPVPGPYPPTIRPDSSHHVVPGPASTPNAETAAAHLSPQPVAAPPSVSSATRAHPMGHQQGERIGVPAPPPSQQHTVSTSPTEPPSIEGSGPRTSSHLDNVAHAVEPSVAGLPEASASVPEAGLGPAPMPQHSASTGQTGPYQPFPLGQPPATPGGAADRKTVTVRPLSPGIDVPEQFKATWRRSQKLLLRQIDPRLVKALNAFIDALNAGVTGDALEEIGDELEDAYFDVRNRAT